MSRYGLRTLSSLKLKDQLQQAALHHIGVLALTCNGRMLRNVSKSNMIIDVHASDLMPKCGGNFNRYRSGVECIRAMVMPSSALFKTIRRGILRDVPRSLFIEASGRC
ncbi:hypothetical protein BDN70DRAFT_926406 [Pholiota conissans]|uniref:Uncharacterized protein n=1 Tax=Pholiota conissans TaxID=109636 RepID=A0A9P5YN45_9AGAR|nr:hypothetical protein BDN70DRAFT_926406 [Pholiota conissans]